jgi:hypothetical protein
MLKGMKRWSVQRQLDEALRQLAAAQAAGSEGDPGILAQLRYSTENVAILQAVCNEHNARGAGPRVRVSTATNVLPPGCGLVLA